MSRPFQVDVDALDGLAARIANLAGFFSDELDQLDAQVRKLHEAGWDGPAAAAHLDAHAEWRIAAADFVEHAARLRELAHHAHGKYVAARETNLRMLGICP